MGTVATSTPHRAATAATRRPAAILAGELRNFTRMSDMLDAERVLALAGEYFVLLGQCIAQHGGRVIDTHNDSAIAAFEVGPGATDIGPAIKAAQELLVDFGMLAEKWQHAYGLHVAVAVGLHLGETVFGRMPGQETPRDTVFGDVVTIAERLVHRARAGEIVLSEPVMQAIAFSGLAIEPEALPPLELARRPALRLFGVLLDTRLDFT